MSIGKLVDIQDFAFAYSAKGRIIKETSTLWVVRVFAESTLGKEWAEQTNPIRKFYKKSGLNVGHSKDIYDLQKCTLQNTNKVKEK